MLNIAKRAVGSALQASARIGAGPRRKLAIFVPASAGSLGDQALVDSAAALAAEMGYRPLLVRLGGWAPIEVRTPSDHLELRSYGLAGALAMRRIVRECDHAVIIGADTVDGVYGHAKVEYWGEVMGRLAKAGLGTRFAGFSVSETPHAQLLKQVAALTDTGFYLRDAVSLERFERATGRSGVLTADFAFGLRPEITSPAGRAGSEWLEAERGRGQSVMGFNISSHVAESAGDTLLPALSTDLGGWLLDNPDYSCLLIPHDVRGEGQGDIGLLASLMASLPDEAAARCHLLGSSLAAWDVKALCADLDFLFTGRMHVAIAALGGGTPSAAAAYQGKFEGLYQHFGLDAQPLCLSPARMSEKGALRPVLDMLAAEAPELRNRVTTALPQVRALTSRNLAFVPRQ